MSDNYKKYYDATDLLSYKELYKILLKCRGLGGTFRFKLTGIRKFLKSGKQFIYVRRYKTEHKNIKQFFDDIIETDRKRKEKGLKPYIPDGTKLAVKGNWKDGAGEFLVNGKTAGYWLTLSVGSTYKSTAYPNVDMLIFDEFIIKKGTYHYLPEEVTDFEDLVETVFRDRDNMTGVVMIANKISWYNPYFVQWKIRPFNTEFFRVPNDSIVVQQPDSESFKQAKYSTRLGEHLKNSKYGAYSIENESLIDDSNFVSAMPNTARPYFKVRYAGETYGIWLDLRENKMYLSKKFDPYCKLEYALTTSDHNLNTYFIKNKRNTRLVDIISFYEQGRLFADGSFVDNVLQEILQLLL